MEGQCLFVLSGQGDGGHGAVRVLRLPNGRPRVLALRRAEADGEGGLELGAAGGEGGCVGVGQVELCAARLSRNVENKGHTAFEIYKCLTCANAKKGI